MRSIQSGDKEHTDDSGHDGRGHLVLVCTVCRRPRPLLLVSRLHWRLAGQTGVTKPDFLRSVEADQT